MRPTGVEAALDAWDRRPESEDQKVRAIQMALDKSRYEADRIQRQYDASDPAKRAGQWRTRTALERGATESGCAGSKAGRDASIGKGIESRRPNPPDEDGRGSGPGVESPLMSDSSQEANLADRYQGNHRYRTSVSAEDFDDGPLEWRRSYPFRGKSENAGRA
jgi:hypothetical protein